MSRKMRPSQTSAVQSAIGVSSYEDLGNYAHGIRQLRGQNCVSSACTVRDSLLAGDLRAASETGGKYVTMRNYRPVRAGEGWAGPFQTDAQIYRHVSMHPEGSVFTMLQRGYHGQTGVLGAALDALDAGHFSTAVRTHPRNSARMAHQIFEIDGHWGEVREITRTDTSEFADDFFLLYEGAARAGFE